MEDILFVSSVAFFSSFTMIYGNLASNAIGKSNALYVQNNPVIMYLTIFFYVVFLVTTMYKENIPKKIPEIILLSLLIFLIISLIVSSHPLIAISSAFVMLIIYIYYIQKPKKKIADYI
jgi:hypothetical protein